MNGEESKRLCTLLDEAIHASRRSRRGIERKLGWGQGYLGSLLHGRIELKVSHVYILARELGIEPLSLFLQASPPRDPQWILDQLGAGVPQEKPDEEDEPDPSEGPLLTRDEIEELVRRTLREELARIGVNPDEAGEPPEEDLTPWPPLPSPDPEPEEGDRG